MDQQIRVEVPTVGQCDKGGSGRAPGQRAKWISEFGWKYLPLAQCDKGGEEEGGEGEGQGEGKNRTSHRE